MVNFSADMPFQVKDFKQIVVLTGAGVSAESGLATFRDSGGLWENHRLEDVATPEAFAEDPRLVWAFYSARRKNATEARPNAAHAALAEFARRRGPDRFLLVTQNVDGLHERAHAAARAPAPLAMHGTLNLSRCPACERTHPDDTVYFDAAGRPLAGGPYARDAEGLPLSPCCPGPLRPHIVWFGEVPLGMDQIQARVEACDLFVTIGSSGQVYPAAGFLELAKHVGATTACLNPEALPQKRYVDHYVAGPATVTVPACFRD